MTISELLCESTIKVGLEACSKTEAIEELVDMLLEEHELSLVDRPAVIHAVLEREQMMSTGMENGVALPHGAVDCVDSIVAAAGISHAGIDFDSVDGQPAHIILLLILPAGKYSSSVRTMAGVARLLNHPTLRGQICFAESAEEVLDVLIAEEEKQLLDGGH